MSGMSANVQRGNHNIAENILNKMLKVLESSGEIKNGNQYFFLASILLGVVCYTAGKFDQAHMFFTGTMRKQLDYVENEQDHPFLEQTYTHMAVMYKQIGNPHSSLIMWRNVLKTHQRLYGENNYILASDYKHIGTSELSLNKHDDAIEALNKAKDLAKFGLEELEDAESIREQKKELSEIYFALYLAYVSSQDWDQAISANEQSLKINIEVLGENDLNVANNYYLGAQIYLKKFSVDEALRLVNKANEIIDTKPSKEPLLLARYRFLRAKLYQNKERNEEALKDLDAAILVAEGNPQLYTDEIEIKNFRRNLINSLSNAEIAKLGINVEEEKVKEEQDENKKKEVENMIRKSRIEQSLKNQGIDPSTVDTNKLMGEEGQEEAEEEAESFLDTPVGMLTALGGVIAVAAGAFYLFKKN